MRSLATTFTRSLRGFLGSARNGGLFSKRVVRSTPSLPSTLEAIEGVFSDITASRQNSYNSHGGYRSAADQKLASSVLNNLIQIQSDFCLLDDTLNAAPESPSAKAAHAYQNTQDNLPAPDMTVFSWGS